VLRLLSAKRLHGLIITIIFVIVALSFDKTVRDVEPAERDSLIAWGKFTRSNTIWYWRLTGDLYSLRRMHAESDSLLRLHKFTKSYAILSWRRGDDPDTVMRTDAEFDSLLSLHAEWLGDSTKGERLCLPDVRLWGVNLRRADLSGADLTGAGFWGVEFSGANLSRAILSNADLLCLDLSGVNLSRADLSAADLSGSLLFGANLSQAYLSRVGFYYDTLLSFSFTSNGLTDFDSLIPIPSANLTDVWFENIDSLPLIPSAAQAIGLRTLTYLESPASLVSLREEFGKLGFRAAERQIICALRRHNAGKLETLFFDWTSEYGSNLARPWQIFIGVFIACFVAYYIFMLKEWESGVRIIVPIASESNDGSSRRFVLKHDESSIETTIFRRNDLIKEILIGYCKVPMSIRLIWWAVFFSGMSAFNIGFRDVNFGRWLKLLTRTKFDLQPFGWVRVVSGFQALMSVYLIALWILSFSGTPFK